ncbi:MAG: hypothetical protein CR994_08030 [Maribacter sp.]|nr:MAG: hypothetical protein CR994_08030 [Maribacter sp.]
MKNLKYLILISVAFATYSCVEDALFESEEVIVEGSALKLNEIMSKDVNDNPDWIEIYNGGTEDIDISGYILNDKDVAEGGFVIPSGTIIQAGGFYRVDADTSGESISSGGEDVSLAKPDGTIIDLTTTPDMSGNVGLTWAREIDGDGEWMISPPTPGTSNGSAANTAPILSASEITEFTSVYSVNASDTDGILSVKLVYMVNDGVTSFDMSLVEGEYKTSIPQAMVGDVVKYYVVATDKKGMSSYYPENGSNEPAEFVVVGGIGELDIEGEDAGFRGEVTFTATPYYPGQVDEIRLYYLLPGELQDDVNDDKTKVVLTQEGDTFTGTIPAQDTGDIIGYYLRVEYIDGTKTYFPTEELDADENVIGDFNHDLGTTWPNYTVEAITYDDVVGGTVNPTEGPLTSLTFPTNPVPGTDINLVLAYTSTEEIKEARVYFAVGDSPVYIKANKVRGEDDPSFTQTSVTINLKDEVSDAGEPLSATGTKVSFYIRIATDAAEYYYSNTGAMFLDDTPGGGTTDESDAFKEDPSLWNVYNVQ